MKIGLRVAAALLIAASGWPRPAAAQGLPGGSYLQSCADIGMQGDALVAVCRTVDGSMRRSYLPDVRRCVGDIGNNNGHLQCSYAGGAPSYSQPPPPYGQPPGPPPGYGR